MSYANASSSKKKKNKPKKSQSRSRTKPSRSNGSTPSLNHSRSANSHKKPKQPHSSSKHKKTQHKVSTPPPTKSSLRKKRSKTPKPIKSRKSKSNSKIIKASKSNSKSNTKPTKSPRSNTLKSPNSKPHKIEINSNKSSHKPSKSLKPRTTSSPLRPSKDSPFKMKKIDTPKPLKQRTASTPKPIKTKSKTKHTKNKKKPSSAKSANPRLAQTPVPVLKQSRSSSTDHSIIDQRRNLSPTSLKNSVKNDRKNAKKRSFYGDAYATKQKGKLQTLYKVKEKIGSGTFSTVRRGIRRSDKQEIAIKIITKTDLNDTEARLIKREIGVMEKLSNHANIVKLYDIFETTHHLYLIIEYCKGGELFDELINCTPKGWFSERETSQIIRQIAEGLKFMHYKKIIHRDLKLENILVSMKKNYNINKKKKKFSMDDENSDDDDYKNTNKPRGGSSHTVHFKKNKSDRGVISVLRADVSHSSQNEEDLYDEDSDNEGLAGFINRRHSDCISRIPPSIMYGHGVNDHNGPESSIIIKISDFGLSKKLELPLVPKNIGIIDEKKEEKKKKHKIPHILSKRKKKKNNQLNDREFAVMATNCGTLYYVAPEILNNEPYNEKVDMWSLGVICYVLLCGSLPFYSENELEISDLILKCKYDLGETDDHWLKVSDSAKDLIQNLLTLDKKNRLNAHQVLTHPFITGQNKLKSAKRNSLKWNAGSLFGGKWPMKFKNMLGSAKNISFLHDSDIDTNSDQDRLQPPPSPNKKVKYKIHFDSEHE